jgi:CYTH domain-containing protein
VYTFISFVQGRGKLRPTLIAVLLGALIAGAVLIFPATHTAQTPTQAYVLTAADKSLIGPVDSALSSKISYDAKTNEYVFNQAGKGLVNGLPQNAAQSMVGPGDAKTPNPYSIDLPVDPSKGFTYYDNEMQLSFTAVPEFQMGSAQRIADRIVYSLPGGGLVIYTVKGNGLKEDVVFEHSVPTQTLSYRLVLPNTLESRTISGGAIGIYSADPALFEHITYSTPSDQMKVIQARQNSDKKNLVFTIPPPLIKQTNQQPKNGTGNVRYDLSGSTLQVIGEGLTNLGYPISLDPSVVVNTTAGFAVGNNEGNIDYPANQINRGGLTGGMPGAWTASTSLATGSLPAATYEATSVAYNGYLYEIGGFIGAPTAIVDYAPLNASTGAVGAWTASTSLATGSLPTATYYATSVAYNGYLYEIGGCATSCPTAIVDHAPINASTGAVGAWTASTSLATGSLPTATDQATSVAYNGYVYEIGGFTTATTAIVDYAPINANGSVGAWTASTSLATGSLPTATDAATSVVYNGYLYEIGGCQGSACGTIVAIVDYAPINANGSVGAWTASTSLATGSLPAATYDSTSVAYNGYLYEIGGYTTALTAIVDYVGIQPAGYLGTGVATTVLPVARYHATSVAYNGFLYEIGGFTGAAITTVDYVAINADGTLATPWLVGTVLPAANYNSTSVAYNGYLYEIGGCAAACPSAIVDYAPITAGTGAVGAWTASTSLATGSLPAATEYSTSVVYNGYVYEIGGFDGAAPTAVVDYALLNVSTGAVGAWAATTVLLGPVDLATSVAYNGYLYEIGGAIPAVSAVVDYVKINANGTLNASPGWQVTTSLPVATEAATSVAYDGYLYEIGGFTTVKTATIDYAPINSDGTVGAWTATTSLLAATYYASSVAYNGFLYEIGGFTTVGVATVDYILINNGGPGTTGAWTASTSLATGSLPTATDSAASAVYNGYLYQIGGCLSTCATAVAVVDYAPINANGSVGAWTASTSLATGSLPTGTSDEAAVAYNGYLYEIGGTTTAATAVVGYAPLNASTGAVGAWTDSTSLATGSLPTATYQAGAAVYNGYLYEIGGNTGSATAIVDYAPLNASTGAVGAWTASTSLATGSLPTATYRATSVVYNGYLYEIGGCTGTCTTAHTAVVDYALINVSTHAVGAWTATTGLPTATYKATSVAYDGYLYEIGGFGAAATAVVDLAPINADGTLGDWSATTSLPAARYASTSVAYKGYVYEIGGDALTAVVDYAPLNVMPRVGHYSQLVNLGVSNATLTTITYTGTLPGGLGAISFATAAAAGTFSAQALASSLTGSNGASNIQYVWVFFTLDDSQVGGFADSIATTNANVTSFTINYTLPGCTHPAPGVRLRGGKTLINGVLTPLDTCFP